MAVKKTPAKPALPASPETIADIMACVDELAAMAGAIFPEKKTAGAFQEQKGAPKSLLLCIYEGQPIVLLLWGDDTPRSYGEGFIEPFVKIAARIASEAPDLAMAFCKLERKAVSLLCANPDVLSVLTLAPFSSPVKIGHGPLSGRTGRGSHGEAVSVDCSEAAARLVAAGSPSAQAARVLQEASASGCIGAKGRSFAESLGLSIALPAASSNKRGPTI